MWSATLPRGQSPVAARLRELRPAASRLNASWNSVRVLHTLRAAALSSRSARRPAALGSLHPLCCDIFRQVAQRTKNFTIFLAVGAQLDAIFLGDDQRDLQDVNGIQPQTLAIERCIGADIARIHFKIERLDNEASNLTLERTRVGCYGLL